MSRAPAADGPVPARAAPRVLLLGASGRLGCAIAAEFARPAPQRVELVAPSRADLALDLAAPEDAVRRWLERWRPDCVVNGIAIGDVDRCEIDPPLATRLNAALPQALARACAQTGARLVHFSTDFVFDGALRRPYREDDEARPLSVYGASKLAGEAAIADSGCRHWIFRVSWLYGAASRNLAADLLDPANGGRVFHLASDRVGVPNPVQRLAVEVARCIARDGDPDRPAPPSGVYHLSCHGATTWHAFGQAFLREAVRAGRLRAERVPRIEAIDESSLGRPARRPAWSVLDPSRYERCFARRLPGWEAAIASALPGSDAARAL